MLSKYWSESQTNLLGQSMRKHLSTSLSSPVQFVPLYAGSGLSQALILNIVPLLQEVLQLDHSVQFDQPPSTIIQIYIHNIVN